MLAAGGRAVHHISAGVHEDPDWEKECRDYRMQVYDDGRPGCTGRHRSMGRAFSASAAKIPKAEFRERGDWSHPATALAGMLPFRRTSTR